MFSVDWLDYIALELYFLEVSVLMHSFSKFGQISCPVFVGHNLWHLFASYVTLFIHTILYYAYYCITIPGRPANTNTTIFFCDTYVMAQIIIFIVVIFLARMCHFCQQYYIKRPISMILFNFLLLSIFKVNVISFQY